MGSHSPSTTLSPQLPLWLVSIASLGIVLLQLVLFLPGIVEGRTFSLAFLLAYRVDSLSLTFGVAWMLTLALVTAVSATSRPEWSSTRRNSLRAAWSVCLMALGLLSLAYSRDLLSLYIGWEILELALWLALRPMWYGHKRWLLLALHSPGWLLLAILALGLAMPLVPPPGGVALPWPLPVVIALSVAVLTRSGCWPFHAWPRTAAEASGGAGATLLALYCMAAPYLLAKTLVAAPWDPTGIWALTLLGTVGLLGSVITIVGLRGVARIPAIVSAHAAASLIGFGLSPGSPLAAMGAVALLLSGTLWIVAITITPARNTAWDWIRVLGGWGTLLGSSVGVWAIAQGALGLRYGIVAVVLLPAGAMMLLDDRRRTMDETPLFVHRPSSIVLRLFLAALLIATGTFPQALVEWVLRPVVGAMAGGVSALRFVSSEWGVGLLVSSSDETVLAALPATGIALAVALALITLYWLRRLVRRFMPEISNRTDF